MVQRDNEGEASWGRYSMHAATDGKTEDEQSDKEHRPSLRVGMMHRMADGATVFWLLGPTLGGESVARDWIAASEIDGPRRVHRTHPSLIVDAQGTLLCRPWFVHFEHGGIPFGRVTHAKKVAGFVGHDGNEIVGFRGFAHGKQVLVAVDFDIDIVDFSGAGAEGYRGDRDFVRGFGVGPKLVAEHDDIRVTCRGVVFDAIARHVQHFDEADAWWLAVAKRLEPDVEASHDGRGCLFERQVGGSILLDAETDTFSGPIKGRAAIEGRGVLTDDAIGLARARPAKRVRSCRDRSPHQQEKENEKRANPWEKHRGIAVFLLTPSAK